MSERHERSSVLQQLAWRVGGPQGSGVDTAALIFSRASAMGGLHLYGRREYYSNIMGRHSYYDVRVGSRPLTCHRDTVDLLTTFEAETLARHALAVVEGGAIVHSEEGGDTELDRITFLDTRFKQDLAAHLAERDLPPSNAGLLEDARSRGVQTYLVPYSEILQELADTTGVDYSVAQRTRNTVAVAISCALLEYGRDNIRKALERQFPGRDKIIDLNVEAVNLAYRYVREHFDNVDFDFRLEAEETDEPRLLLNGNQTAALGKLAGGMTFQTYYPISPATDESVYLEAHETFDTADGDGSVVVVQTEDEIAAVTMAAGAALTGARSATATSGPGFSLMVEGLGWAAINEVPLVITLYQRGSPSTGMPTRNDQGDLLFAVRAGHGEAPRIVLASGDIVEAFYDAAQAFNYAERYQMVVLHLLDKALASTTQTLPPFDLGAVPVERGDIYSPDGGDGVSWSFEPPDPEGSELHGQGSYLRFKVTDSGISTRPLLGQPGGMHWITGGEHTERGRVTEDPVVRERMMEKRARKLELAASEIPVDEKFRVYGDRDAAFTVLSWGSNKGGIQEALALLEEEGFPIRLVQMRMLWPFPHEVVDLLEGAEPLVIVESNYSGQLASLLREATGVTHDHLVVKYNGRPMSARELRQAFLAIREGGADERIVLRNPHE